MIQLNFSKELVDFLLFLDYLFLLALFLVVLEEGEGVEVCALGELVGGHATPTVIEVGENI